MLAGTTVLVAGSLVAELVDTGAAVVETDEPALAPGEVVGAGGGFVDTVVELRVELPLHAATPKAAKVRTTTTRRGERII